MSNKRGLVKIRLEKMKDEELRQSAEILKRELWARGQESEIAPLELRESREEKSIELQILAETMSQGEVVVVRSGLQPERVKLEDAVDRITELLEL